MRLSDIFLAMGEDTFTQLLRNVSIGKLKTFQLYERVKLRFHLAKLNSESLRKAAPRLWARVRERDEEFTVDIGQTILVSHLEMIAAVLDYLQIPHQNGFFDKELDVTNKLSEGWQQRTYSQFAESYPRPVLLFYINHLDWELTKSDSIFSPDNAIVPVGEPAHS